MWLPEPDPGPPPLMALGTIGPDGYPRSRHVVLSECGEQGIYFHTDARSAKVTELANDPRATVAVAWPSAARQVVAHGDVMRASADEELSVYRRRGRYLQLLAWLNTEELAQLPTAERRAQWAEFDRAHDRLDPPPDWAGFVLRPREIAFWRGDPDGPSQRIRYRRPDPWKIRKRKPSGRLRCCPG